MSKVDREPWADCWVMGQLHSATCTDDADGRVVRLSTSSLLLYIFRWLQPLPDN